MESQKSFHMVHSRLSGSAGVKAQEYFDNSKKQYCQRTKEIFEDFEERLDKILQLLIIYFLFNTFINKLMILTINISSP